MKEEDKDLLLKDLCVRLPYRVIVELDENFGYNKGTRYLVKELLDIYCVESIKPYLRPISSMTRKEKLILNDLTDYVFESSYESIHNNIDELNEWLNVNHFDYRGLIKKGLAIEALEGMYNKIK